jgi:two-component system NarL family sensor kinase
MKWLHCVIFLTLYSSLTAQDTAFSRIEKMKADSNRIHQLHLHILDIVYNQPQQAIAYSDIAIKWSKAISNDSKLAKSYNLKGIAYDVSSNYDSSMICYQLALPLQEKTKSAIGIGSTSNNIGMLYQKHGNDKLAVEYFIKALQQFDLIKSEQNKANALNNLGMSLLNMKIYPAALKNLFAALEINKKLNSNYNAGSNCTNIAMVYDEQMDDAREQFYLEEALRYHELEADDYGLAIANNNLGEFYLLRKDYSRSLLHLNKAMLLQRKINDAEGLAHAFRHFARLKDAQSEFVPAKQYLDSSYQLVTQNNFSSQLVDVYHAYAEHYQKTGDYKNSHFYLEQYSRLKDSIFTRDNAKIISELSAKYEDEKRQNTIQQQQHQLNLQKLGIYAGSGFTLLAALLAFSYYRRRKLKAEKDHQQKLLLVEEKNARDIMEAEDNERKRIAADLHDGVGQMMTVAKMNFSSLEAAIQTDQPENKSSFLRLESLLDNCCTEVRRISHRLMPQALVEEGLIPAIKGFLRKIDPAVLETNMYAEGLETRLNTTIENSLYRIVQECVNNILKHSKASRLDITAIRDEEGLSLSIEDDGVGFDKSMVYDGIGMKHIQSRVAFIKGNLEIDSAPGKGTLVNIFIAADKL